MTQIRSDDQQFQDLQDESQIKQSIKGPPEMREQRRNIRVQIKEAQNGNQKNLIENLYYSITVYDNQKPSLKDIKRRFSDFDLLFDIISRQYKGFILPAFPQNGIMSYVKSKVSLTKDDKFLKQRIDMVERFLTILMNQPAFYQDKCPPLQKFFSQKEFDLFKKREKQKSQSLISSSWNKIWSYMKTNKDGKYKIIQQQLINDKKIFEDVYKKTKCMIELLQQQKQQIDALEKKQLTIAGLPDYIAKQKRICDQQLTNLNKLRKLAFQLYCENEDYVMVLKLIKNIQDLKNNEQNYSILDQAQKNFGSQYEVFKKKKKQLIKNYNKNLDQLLKDVSNTDAQF